jgi:type 1 glutamine amidotransferase
MGKRTGAFETVVSRDPAIFEPASLRQFDAVFFNNTVGNCFEDPALRQSLVEFVYSGGGLMGVHGTSVAFTKWPGAIEDWPEFGIMLGARGANHKANNEHVFIKLDDPTHPVNRSSAGRTTTTATSSSASTSRTRAPPSRAHEHRHGQDRHATATVLRGRRADDNDYALPG